jgi:von Willebrand factor type A domain
MSQQPLLVGFALDVSGSMSSSLTNAEGGQLARLDGIRRAVDTVLDEAQRLASVVDAPKRDVRFFAYAFGFRIPGHGVCDLFRVLEVQSERHRYSSQWDMLRAIQSERTLTLADVKEKWGSFRNGIGTTNEYMGGGTPMREAFERAQGRFEREATQSAARRMFFVVSDGGSTDGDPRAPANEVKRGGGTIVSCFISSSNLVAPKELVTVAPADEGAKTMFDVASEVVAGSDEEQYLKARGWKTDASRSLCGRRKPPKLFSQVNHSEVLNEFIQVVLTPLELEKSLVKKSLD